MSLDEAEASFTRRPQALEPQTLSKLAGTYENPTGVKFQVELKQDRSLYVVMPGEPEEKLIPYKGLQFRVKEFSDRVWEFVMENQQVKSLEQRDPSGEIVFPRR
jgi:hypothetical protein